MKLKSILALLLFSSIISYSQDTKKIEKKYLNSVQTFEEYYVLMSDNKVKHGLYTSFYRIDELSYKSNKYNSEQNIKEKGLYNLGKKHGEWIELRGKGKYDNGKKIGVWEYCKIDFVTEKFDYSLNKKLQPIITIYVDSPPRKHNEAPVQGVVKVKYKQNLDCSITDISIIEGMQKEYNEEAIKAIERFAVLNKKYSFDCQESIETISLKFTVR